MITTAENAITAWLHQRDQAAAASLVHEHRSLVLGTARRWGVPAEMEQDAVQEVFLRVFNKLHLFQPEKPFAHWLSGVARNTCAKLRRHWCHRHRLSAVFEGAAVDVSECDLRHEKTPETEATSRETVIGLNAALARLSPRERELVEKHHLEGESPAETAERLGMKPTAARVALHRALQKLQSAALLQSWHAGESRLRGSKASSGQESPPGSATGHS
jgi:RNA polymerase sigma-70 factor (ECF subfamily)